MLVQVDRLEFIVRHVTYPEIYVRLITVSPRDELRWNIKIRHHEQPIERHTIWVRHSRRYHPVIRILSWTIQYPNRFHLEEHISRGDSLQSCKAVLPQSDIGMEYSFLPLDQLLRLKFDVLGYAYD